MNANLRSNLSRRGSPWLMVRACVGFGFVLLSALLLNAQDRFDGVRTLIRQRIVDGSVPSVSVAVAQHGKIIWEEGFGWANREERIPATENAMYSLASISKTFTATALMTLVQAGKIDLDKPSTTILATPSSLRASAMLTTPRCAAWPIIPPACPSTISFSTATSRVKSPLTTRPSCATAILLRSRANLINIPILVLDLSGTSSRGFRGRVIRISCGRQCFSNSD